MGSIMMGRECGFEAGHDMQQIAGKGGRLHRSYGLRGGVIRTHIGSSTDDEKNW